VREKSDLSSGNSAQGIAPDERGWWLQGLAWGIFVAWAAQSFATLLTTQDLWTNLRVGQDLLSGGGFPRIEEYSATAAGRPFVAYEWLSALAFTSLRAIAGDAGLVALRVVAGLSCLALLLLSLPQRLRGQAYVLPLLILVDYLICFRAYVRPHLFTLVVLSALCLALERWRRSRRLRDLVWLAPLHQVWANLHGAFLFGIVLLALLAGLVAVLARVPRLQARSGELPYTGRDALALLGVAGACAALSLLNPYGAGIFGLAFEMSESSAYMKAVVLEWQSPLVMQRGDVWFFIYCALLLLAWGSLLLRLKERPWLDALLVAVMSYQSLRASRFVPFLAIFAFPILVRGAERLAASWRAERAAALRPWLYAGLCTFMLATSLGDLSRLSPRAYRELGWGWDASSPFDEVRYMRERNLKGVVFNEYVDGALLIQALHPRIRPVMDSRINVYGAELYREWKSIWSAPKRLFPYLDRYAVDYVLLFKRERNRHLLDSLAASPDWQLAAEFDRRVLYARRRKAPGPATLGSRFERRGAWMAGEQSGF